MDVLNAKAAQMEAEGHELLARGHALLAQAARARASATSDPAAPLTPAVDAVLLNKQGCAEALGVSTATLDRLVRDGRVPFVRVGDCRRFDLAAVRAALGSNAAPASAPKGTSEVIPGVRLSTRRRPVQRAGAEGEGRTP